MVDLCRFSKIFYNFLIILAGFPAITQLSSNLPHTTAPAPTTQPSPSTVPFRIMLLHPIKQFLPIIISLLGTRLLSPPFSSRRSLFLASTSRFWAFQYFQPPPLILRKNEGIMSATCSAIKQARSRGILHEFYTPP